ncbi:MAG TPA: polysaccharide biosynthesis C-terminal domain-containing protein [Gaiellaceae bacterium]|jgi:O-antigen/teichoic acid export membrane protein
MDDATPVPLEGPQQRLRTDVFLTFAGKGATLVLSLLIAAVVARRLGTADQGTFAVAYSLTLMLVQLGSLGFTTANPYYAVRRPEWITRIVGNAIWLSVFVGFALVGVGAAIKLVAPGVLEGLAWTPLLVALAGVPGALAALLLQSILLGEGRMVAYNTVDVTQAALTLAALLVLYAVADVRVTGTLAVLGAGRYAAALAYGMILSRNSTIAAWPDASLARQMIAYGFRVYVAILVSFLVIRLDLLLVNAFLGASEAGLYSVAATLADGMFVLPMVVGLNLFTRVARGDPTEASAEVFRSIFVLYGLVCLATIPLAGIAIRAFFGAEFEGATSLYYWLLPGIFCLGMLTILSHHFAGRGYPVQAMAFWAFGLALNIALNLAFLPGRSASVAALTSSITYAVVLTLHMWLFVKEAGTVRSIVPRPREVLRFVRVALSRA